MELALKLPKGKPPFIGILFKDEISGNSLHTEVVEKFQKNEYHLLLEHTKSTLNLRLICAERVMVYFYNHLSFDAEKLKSWLYLTKDSTVFNFGHIYKQFDKDCLISTRPGRKNFVVKVTRCKLISAEDNEEFWNLPFTISSGKW